MLLLATNVPPAPSATGITAAIARTRSKYGPTSSGVRSESVTTCRHGITNVCPGNNGLVSRNATATSSRNTSNAGTRPATMSQKTHGAATTPDDRQVERHPPRPPGCGVQLSPLLEVPSDNQVHLADPRRQR